MSSRESAIGVLDELLKIVYTDAVTESVRRQLALSRQPGRSFVYPVSRA